MAKTRTIMACRECRQQVAQWAGRCPACQAWGTIHEVDGFQGSADRAAAEVVPLHAAVSAQQVRVTTGLSNLDRVLGGGVVPGSVTLLAGEPGIGKSTLLLQVLAGVAGAGHPCLLVSGEESHAQVADRARRLGGSPRTVVVRPRAGSRGGAGHRSPRSAVPAGGGLDPSAS